MNHINSHSKNAIILAAGIGSRFIPITYEIPKGLIKVFNKPMIERQIEQLLDISVTDITIVVGYLSDEFEYLKSKYGVKLLYSKEYSYKNNLSSIFHARHLIKNTYILSSDNFMTKNIFNINESNSWYSVVKSTGKTKEWCVTINNDNIIKKIEIGGENKWYLYGPAYFSNDFSKKIIALIEKAYYQQNTENYFWEDVLKNNIDKLTIYANMQKSNVVYEFETIEELRKFDKKYLYNSENKVLEVISAVFNIPENLIINIKEIQSGMTNNVFKFEINNIEYVCRIPGIGSDKLINRESEYNNYMALKNYDFSEKLVYFDKKTNIKISYYEKYSKVIDVNNEDHLRKCMKSLKRVHNSNIQVQHKFDIFKVIESYKQLCNKNKIKFNKEYYEVEAQIPKVISKLKEYDVPLVFSHIDANCDNCLILPSGEVKIIDWEYASMCDPLIDVSMFAMYSYMNNSQINKLVEFYLKKEPTSEQKMRIYCYIVLGGFLWALWAEYKESFGIYYNKYKLKMYSYVKQYISRVINEKD